MANKRIRQRPEDLLYRVNLIVDVVRRGYSLMLHTAYRNATADPSFYDLTNNCYNQMQVNLPAGIGPDGAWNDASNQRVMWEVTNLNLSGLVLQSGPVYCATFGPSPGDRRLILHAGSTASGAAVIVDPPTLVQGESLTINTIRLFESYSLA